MFIHYQKPYARPLTSQDITGYGFRGLGDVSSRYLEFSLEPPVLNISAYYLVDDTLGAEWTDRRNQQQPFQNMSGSMWHHANVTYSMQYIKEHGACQPTEVRYTQSPPLLPSSLHYHTNSASRPDLLLGLFLHPTHHHAHPMQSLDHRYMHYMGPHALHHEAQRALGRGGRVQSRA